MFNSKEHKEISLICISLHINFNFHNLLYFVCSLFYDFWNCNFNQVISFQFLSQVKSSVFQLLWCLVCSKLCVLSYYYYFPYTRREGKLSETSREETQEFLLIQWKHCRVNVLKKNIYEISFSTNSYVMCTSSPLWK